MQLGNRILLLLVCGLMASGWAWAEDPQVLYGPAFSDPGHIVAMPETWQQKPITHEGTATDSDIAVTLDQHLYPALLPLIRDYAGQKHLKISVQEGTCGISAGAMMDKKADVGGFCCPPGASDRLPGLKFHTIGIAPLVLLVHPDNPVTNLTLDDARGVFQGRIAYWDQLGVQLSNTGKDALITTIGRLHCKTRPGHWRLLLSNEDLFSPRQREVSTIPDMISEVAHNPTAIGYETVWMTRQFADKGAVKMLNINGVAPDDEKALLSGHYALYRTYDITTWSAKATYNAEADALVRYLEQNAARIDPKYGLVPAAKLRPYGWRFADDELIGEPE